MLAFRLVVSGLVFLGAGVATAAPPNVLPPGSFPKPGPQLPKGAAKPTKKGPSKTGPNPLGPSTGGKSQKIKTLPPGIVAKLKWKAPTKGATGCSSNAPDCNRCTPNVVAQFRKVKNGQANWKAKPWRFQWGRKYPPYAVDGYQAFDEDSDLANGTGISYSHPQGFVRANRAGAMYVGSHSRHDAAKPGTIFIVRQDSTGKKALVALHKTRHKHPSGVHMLGKYVLFGDRSGGRSQLRMLDLDRKYTRHDISYDLPSFEGASSGLKPKFGGGVGAAKLSDGSYLLVSTLKGGKAPGPRYDQFFVMKGALGSSSLAITYAGEHRYENPSWANKDFRYSENISLITECGTGDIFAVHTSGDGRESGVDGLEGGGYWRLSKLERHQGKLRFKPLSVFQMSQNTANCHIRSSATVGVSPNGKLEFLCHQYRKDPDPSALNWFEANTTGNDQWGFRAGTAR